MGVKEGHGQADNGGEQAGVQARGGGRVEPATVAAARTAASTNDAPPMLAYTVMARAAVGGVPAAVASAQEARKICCPAPSARSTTAVARMAPGSGTHAARPHARR